MKKTLNLIRFDMIFFQILIMLYLLLFGSDMPSYVLIILFLVTALNLIYILYELEKIHGLIFDGREETEALLLLDEEKKKSYGHIKSIKRIYKEGTRQELIDYIDKSQKEYYDEKVLTFDLEILNIIIQRYLHICEKHDIEMTYDIQSNVKALLSAANFSGEQLCTVLGNLMDNAIDVLKAQDGDRHLGLSILGNGYQVIIEVTNNGERISDQIKAKLFNYGFSTKAEGRGSGLFIVYKLIEKLGAKLTVESDDVLTSFKIIFELE